MRKAHIKIDEETFCCQYCPLAISLGFKIQTTRYVHVGTHSVSFEDRGNVKVICAYTGNIVENPTIIPDWCPFKKEADNE